MKLEFSDQGVEVIGTVRKVSLGSWPQSGERRCGVEEETWGAD